jgi:hypothetical protein
MQIQCPNCGEKVRAENINIQEKIAVCSACDTVFKFEMPEEKTKRRKVKQPQNLIVRDSDESLKMSFRTNFRLDANEGFVGSSIMIVIGILLGGLMLGAGVDTGEIPLILPVGFLVLAVVAFYNMALIAYNQTEIEMDEEVIRLSRKPLPSVLGNQKQEILLSGVVSFSAEETPKSAKEAYDTPRYHVWANFQDGSRKIVVADLIEDYAHFIAQVMEERLQGAEHLEMSRLEDVGQGVDDETVLGEVSAKKQGMS